MTSPLRKKHRITARNEKGKANSARRNIVLITMSAAVLLAAIPSRGGDTAVRKLSDNYAANGAANSAPGQTKLKWRPVRPSGEEVTSPVRTARYEQDVFSDESKAASPRVHRDEHVKAAVNLNAPTNAAVADPFEDRYSQTAPRRMASVLQEPGEIPPPATRELPPTLQLEPTPAEPAPRELPPSDFPPSVEPRTVPPSPLPMSDPLQPTPSGRPDPFSLPSRGAEPAPLPDAGLTPSVRGGRNASEDCQAAYDLLKKRTVDSLDLSIAVTGKVGIDIPYECTLSNDQFTPRCWGLTTYTWKASALCHKPLYFEEAALERYGHSHGPICEYLVSGAHFFGNLILLPYHMGVQTPCECDYALGYYRPGNCAPYMIDPFPLSVRGAAFGAAGYCGVVALFP